MGVERLGEVSRGDRVLRGEKLDAEARTADAAAGIDPRAEQETERVGREGRLDLRHFRERGEAWALQLVQPSQAQADEGTVDAGQRHDVGDGREADEVGKGAQVGLRDGLAGIESRLAQRAVERDGEQEGDAGGADMAEARAVARLVRIDVRECGRRRLHRVVVEDHDVEPGVARCRQCRHRACTAIDGEDEADALRFQLQKSDRVRAVALGHTVGDVDAGSYAQS